MPSFFNQQVHVKLNPHTHKIGFHVTMIMSMLNRFNKVVLMSCILTSLLSLYILYQHLGGNTQKKELSHHWSLSFTFQIIYAKWLCSVTYIDFKESLPGQITWKGVLDKQSTRCSGWTKFCYEYYHIQVPIQRQDPEDSMHTNLIKHIDKTPKNEENILIIWRDMHNSRRDPRGESLAYCRLHITGTYQSWMCSNVIWVLILSFLVVLYLSRKCCFGMTIRTQTGKL